MWQNQRKVSKNTRKSHKPHHRTSVRRICSGCLFDKCKKRCRTRRYSMIWPYCVMVLTDHSLLLATGFLQAKLADGEITQLYCFCELYLYITMSITSFWRPILRAFDTASLLEVSYLEKDKWQFFNDSRALISMLLFYIFFNSITKGYLHWYILHERCNLVPRAFPFP